MELIIDHVMFPIYNNNKFLTEVAKEWEKKYSFTIDKQNKLYKGIYLFCRNFYIEHLSTTIGNYYWTNAICVQCDKKYWKFYKNPDSICDDFITPKFGCGFFIVSPNSKYTKWRNKNKYKRDMDIYVSNKLYNSLRHLCGLKWTIPKYIKKYKLLLHSYDIVIMDKSFRVAPLFQTNTQLVNSV